MGFHTFPIERAGSLEDPSRYRYCSREELVAPIIEGPEGCVLDLGCGTGFFTRDVAPFVESILAIDVQPAMLEYLRGQDPPSNVHAVAGAAESIPVRDGGVAVALSTMTFHEYASPRAHAELRRVLTERGRLVVVDWAADGRGEDGPDLDDRFDLSAAVSAVQDAGFHVRETRARPETFLLIARTEPARYDSSASSTSR